MKKLSDIKGENMDINFVLKSAHTFFIHISLLKTIGQVLKSATLILLWMAILINLLMNI